MGQKIDLTGQRFGRLVAIKRVPNYKKRDALWLCKCDCGGENIVDAYRLRNGNTRSCGCLEQENRESRRNIDEYIGKKYNKLLIVNKAPTKKYEQTKVVCECDCGNKGVFTLNYVIKGHTKSCGCLVRKANGVTSKRLYHVWKLMIARCYNENFNAYKDYGGRGITICEEWKNSFQRFYEWAINTGYDENAAYMQCTIDRIDVNRSYCPENCRWVSGIEQSNNRRKNTRVTYNGETHTVAEWARICNMNYTTLFNRLFKFKWGVEDALTIKPIVGGKYHDNKHSKHES